MTRPADYQPFEGDPEALAALGEDLFYNRELSTNNLACASCHMEGAGYADTFAQPFPHHVEMAQRDFGLNEVHLDEMVQICMVSPMAAEPLDWDSEELAALVEFMKLEQEAFQEGR